MAQTADRNPKLSELIKSSNLPQFLSFAREPLDTILGKLRYTNLLTSTAPTGEHAYYRLDILTEGRIDVDLQGRLLEIELYDLTGKLLCKEGIKPDVPNIKTLDLSGYAKGMYFLRLVAEGEMLRTGKIAVH